MALPYPSEAESSAASAAAGDDRNDRTVRSALALLSRHGDPAPADRFALEAAAPAEDALATCSMDLFRRTRDREVFEGLVALVRPGLLRRIRMRTRHLGAALDADEVLQDVLVNIYRYPDRFDAARAGAFRAWSAMIVDNSIRRQMRRRRSGPDLVLQPVEELSRECDRTAIDPSDTCAEDEVLRETAGALGLLLRAYLTAYHELNERERFVLQMVEVNGMRYADIAAVLGVRPEALKMVVFRARRRIHDKLTVMFSRLGTGATTATRDAAA